MLCPNVTVEGPQITQFGGSVLILSPLYLFKHYFEAEVALRNSFQNWKDETA